jgi:hypothetical protein
LISHHFKPKRAIAKKQFSDIDAKLEPTGSFVWHAKGRFENKTGVLNDEAKSPMDRNRSNYSTVPKGSVLDLELWSATVEPLSIVRFEV